MKVMNIVLGHLSGHIQFGLLKLQDNLLLQPVRAHGSPASSRWSRPVDFYILYRQFIPLQTSVKN